MSGHIALSRLKVAAKNWLLHSCHWEVPIVATVDGETVLVAETDEQYAAQFITACNSHADLVKALEDIRGGHFDGASTLAVSGSWKLMVERLQKIAAAALATLTARKVG